jgi:hypothetical protein
VKKWAVLLLLFFTLSGVGQWQLSRQAEIRIVTCGPGQKELYSAFGHSAVRVLDPVLGLDLIYNYGVFDFDQPNFYLNFAKGNLLYKLAVTDYRRFLYPYQRDGRYVREQILHLNQAQKQAYFNFLQWNALPENQTYRYDYFYDNCATRIRDGLQQVLGDTLRFDTNYVDASLSIRELCDLYLTQQPWGDLGIDICLGLPMDKKASAWEYMFLPDYLEQGLGSATLATSHGRKPLVASRQVTFAEEAQDQTPIFRPVLVFLAVLAVMLALSVWQYLKKRYHPLPDFLLFFCVGLIGVLLFILWFFTDHAAAASNFNLLWALPIHFIMAFTTLKESARQKYALVYLGLAIWHGLVVLFWVGLPQDLHLALLPLNLLLGVRCITIYLTTKHS